MRTWISIVAALALAVAVTAVAQETERDAVRILRISPESPVVWGVETTFTIDIEARLASMDDGMVMVGFNTESPLRWHMVSAQALAPGVQRLTFEVTAVPVDWGDRGDFVVTVNMGPRTLRGRHWRPTARDRHVIEVTPKLASVLRSREVDAATHDAGERARPSARLSASVSSGSL